MSLVDEIEALADAAYHYNADQADWDAFRGRIAALESELNDLRGMASIARLAEITRDLTLPEPYVPTRTSATTYNVERSSALPCSNVSDWEDETGG